MGSKLTALRNGQTPQPQTVVSGSDLGRLDHGHTEDPHRTASGRQLTGISLDATLTAVT